MDQLSLGILKKPKRSLGFGMINSTLKQQTIEDERLQCLKTKSEVALTIESVNTTKVTGSTGQIAPATFTFKVTVRPKMEKPDKPFPGTIIKTKKADKSDNRSPSSADDPDEAGARKISEWLEAVNLEKDKISRSSRSSLPDSCESVLCHCPNCGHDFAHPRVINFRRPSEVYDPASCKLCPQRFVNAGYLLRHIRSKHCQCKTCFKFFEHAEALREHMEEGHSWDNRD